jgi:hypothetical protein
MLTEEHPAAQQPRVRAVRRAIAWELDAISVARQIAAWAALAITIAIAVALLLGV